MGEKSNVFHFPLGVGGKSKVYHIPVGLGGKSQGTSGLLPMCRGPWTMGCPCKATAKINLSGGKSTRTPGKLTRPPGKSWQGFPVSWQGPPVRVDKDPRYNFTEHHENWIFDYSVMQKIRDAVPMKVIKYDFRGYPWISIGVGCTHACMHASMHAAKTRLHTCTHARAFARTQACTHARVRAYAHKHASVLAPPPPAFLQPSELFPQHPIQEPWVSINRFDLRHVVT